MLRIHPFVMGHLIGAVMTGAIAGAFIGPRASFIAAVTLLAGAVVIRISWRQSNKRGFGGWAE